MKNWLNQEIFTVGVHNITYGIIIGLAIVWLITWLVIRLSRYLIFRVRRFESGQKHAIFQLLQYVIIITAILYSFEIIHIRWNLIIASSAAILVGVGLGLQNLFNDFMSGIILLMDSTIQVNNIIQLEDNTIGRVEDIRMRTTTLKDREGRYIIVPNRLFTGNKVVNWTMEKQLNRFTVEIGVDYSSDVDRVKSILYKAAENHSTVSKKPAPIVRISDFAESAIVFELLYWSLDIFYMDNHKAEIRWEILQEFRKQNVTIPFPQRTVHMPK